MPLYLNLPITIELNLIILSGIISSPHQNTIYIQTYNYLYDLSHCRNEITLVTDRGTELTIARDVLEAAGKTEEELIAATPVDTLITTQQNNVTSISFS